MRKILVALVVIGGFTVPATAAGAANWGQEVKQCNQAACYSGSTNRGVYVRGQATDTQTPGYGWEILTLASPGSSAVAGF